MLLIRTSLLRFRDPHNVWGTLEIGQGLLQRDETTVFRVPWIVSDTIDENADF